MMLRGLWGLLAVGWLLLHSPEGKEVWIYSSDAHLMVREADSFLWGRRACSEVTVHDTKFAVRECPGDVRRAFDEARDK